jgi:MFS family permease
MTKTTMRSIRGKTKKTLSASKLRIILCFVIIFIYGTLLLMIGYTQGGLKTVLFPNSSNASFMTYLLLAQSFGLIISTLLLSKLLSKVNIRYIFVTGLGIALIMLILIANLNKFSKNPTVLITLFAIFSLILGIGIGPISPLISTYLSAVYSGSKRTTMLSVSNGVYGIGAGIIPLVASAAIINMNGKSFDHIVFFYYIAAGLAALGAIAGYFIDYKHSSQLTSSKIIDKGTASTKFNI